MRTSSVLFVVLLASTAAAAKHRAVRSPAPAPAGPCAVSGLPNFFYSTDRGATWSRNAEEQSRAGAWEMAVIEGNPRIFVAAVGKQMFQSSDGGCTWVKGDAIVNEIHHNVHIVPASQGRAYVWTEDFSFRYDKGTLTPLPMPEAIGGLGVDPGNREHVRVLDLDDGKARQSFDGGATWQDVGGTVGGRITAAAFDPTDFDHILAGVQASGIAISHNGGKTWSAGARLAFVCRVAFAESSPNVVWVNAPSSAAGGWVQRSTDGGAHLEPVGSFGGIENGVCVNLLANPHDANLAVAAFRQFYEFNAATKSVTPWTCCNGRMDWITWDRSDAARVYVFSALP